MAQQPPMTRQQFIASFKPQFRDKVTAMYDQYQRTHKMPSVGKQTAKAVAKDSIPWVAIPTVMAAILRRGLYNTPGQVWGSTKVIGGTALAASILHAAFKAPGEYQSKKRSVPRDYAAAAQNHILTQLQKNASQTVPGTPTPPAQQLQAQQAPATVAQNTAAHPRQNTWSALQWVVSPQNTQAIMAGAAKQNQAPVQSAPVQPKPQQPQKPTQPASTAPQKPVTLDQDAAAAYNKAKAYGRDFMHTTFAPGAQGDRNRMITFGGLALLLAALSGQSFGSALLMGGLGVGLGALINKYMLPRVGGKQWGQAQKFIDGIKDPTLKQRVQAAGGIAIFDYIVRRFSGNTHYDAPGQAFKDYVSKQLSAEAPSGGVRYDPKAGYTLSTGSGTTIYVQDQQANRLSGGQRPPASSGSTTQVTIGKNTKQRPTLRTARG